MTLLELRCACAIRGVSVKEICGETGVTYNTLYYHTRKRGGHIPPPMLRTLWAVLREFLETPCNAPRRVFTLRRLRSGVTVKEAAAAMGVTMSALCNAEHGTPHSAEWWARAHAALDSVTARQERERGK